MTIIEAIITVACSVIASSGLWGFVQKRRDKKDTKAKMILGLGHDRLLFLCMKYIDRGQITHNELENLHEYLYQPYVALGGNGTITQLMKNVSALPVVKVLPSGSEK